MFEQSKTKSKFGWMGQGSAIGYLVLSSWTTSIAIFALGSFCEYFIRRIQLLMMEILGQKFIIWSWSCVIRTYLRSTFEAPNILDWHHNKCVRIILFQTSVQLNWEMTLICFIKNNWSMTFFLSLCPRAPKVRKMAGFFRRTIQF